MNDWLEWRKTGLGGSDSAVVLGYSPFKKAFQLWAEKTGKVEPPDLSGSEPVEWGTRLEDAVHEAYFEKTKRRCGQPIHGVNFPTGQMGLQHPEFDWMLATPDGFIDEYEPLPWESYADRHFVGPGILEIKTTSAFRGKDWDDGPPAHYIVQLQHYMAVTGYTWGSFAVLIGGNEFRVFDVERDEEMINDIISYGSIFWEKVQSGEAPPVDGSPEASRIIVEMNPKSQFGVSVELPDICTEYHSDILGVEAEMVGIKEQLDQLEEHKQRLRNEIKMHIGEAEQGVIPGTGVIYKWKTSHRKGYTVAAREVRVLRVTGKPRGGPREIPQ